jgi:Transglycosylase SLT domain
MLEKLRDRRLALAAAALFIALAANDAVYAQSPSEEVISISDPAVAPGAALTAGEASGIDLPAPKDAVLDLSGFASVDAQSIALVSVSARQIELAKNPDGAKAVATTLINEFYGNWNSSQISCLNQLWTSESHWNFQAHNYRSGAQGIAQALPPTKMEIVSTDWRTNPVTQIKWGLSYIKARYGTPCKALLKKHRSHYY